MAAHRYWRIVSRRQGGSQVGSVAELEMHDAVGGPDRNVGGTAISSSAFSASFTADKAFDRAGMTTYWSAAVRGQGEWLGYDFGAGNAKDIVELKITAPDSTGIAGAMMAFDVEWSDDGAAWTRHCTCIQETAWTAGGVKTFNITRPGTTTHLYWAAIIRSIYSSGAGFVSVGGLRFYNAAGNVVPTTGGTVFYSSVFSGGATDSAANAFDADDTTYWSSSNALPNDVQYVGYKFAAGAAFDAFAVQQVMYPSTPVNSAAVWDVAWSDDGITFFTKFSDDGSKPLPSSTVRERRYVGADPNTLAHRWWRVRAFEFGDGVFHPTGFSCPVLASVAGVEFRAAAGVAPTYPLTGTALSRSGTAANAFDGNPATSCDTGVAAITHDYWGFDYGVNLGAGWVRPVEVMIQARNAADAATRTPKTFAVEWSDDSTVWNLHCIRDLGGGWTAGAARTTAVAPESAATPATGFSTFRLRVFETNGGDTFWQLGIAQLEFRSAAGVAENHNAARANGAFGAADSGATRAVANAFDGDPASYYQSSSSVGQGIVFGFNFNPGTKRKAVELRIQAPAPDGRLAPTYFAVDATEDGGGTWTTLGAFRMAAFANGEARTFPLRTAESNDGLFTQLEIEAAYVPSKNLDPRVSLLALEVAYTKGSAPVQRRRPLYVMG